MKGKKGVAYITHMTHAEIDETRQDPGEHKKDGKMSLNDGVRVARAAQIKTQEKHGWKNIPFQYYSQAESKSDGEGGYTFTNWYEI